MTKQKIIEIFHKNLKNKTRFLKFCNNNYFKYVKQEKTFQFFVVEILRENGLTVIINNFESNKTTFEQYETSYLGNERGISDLFVTECNTSKKGCFLELKSGIEKVFTKKLELKKDVHLTKQQNFLDKMNKVGFVAMFLYPENIHDNFEMLFNIKLKM